MYQRCFLADKDLPEADRKEILGKYPELNSAVFKLRPAAKVDVRLPRLVIDPCPTTGALALASMAEEYRKHQKQTSEQSQATLAKEAAATKATEQGMVYWAAHICIY